VINSEDARSLGALRQPQDDLLKNGRTSATRRRFLGSLHGCAAGAKRMNFVVANGAHPTAKPPFLLNKKAAPLTFILPRYGSFR
jgi:hypothetical protein